MKPLSTLMERKRDKKRNWKWKAGIFGQTGNNKVQQFSIFAEPWIVWWFPYIRIQSLWIIRVFDLMTHDMSLKVYHVRSALLFALNRTLEFSTSKYCNNIICIQREVKPDLCTRLSFIVHCKPYTIRNIVFQHMNEIIIAIQIV